LSCCLDDFLQSFSTPCENTRSTASTPASRHSRELPADRGAGVRGPAGKSRASRALLQTASSTSSNGRSTR
jgi:hypothetical protein